MCCLIAKPKGVALPDIQSLANCWRANPHGAGFAVPGMAVHAMSFADLLAQLAAVDENLPMLLHFRYATHGSKRLRNCHPFRDEALGVSFAHNGIVAVDPVGDMTDSETAFRKVFAPAIKRNGSIFGEAVDRAVLPLLGASKFAFIDDAGGIKTYGPFIERGGAYFSNRSFEPSPWRWA